MFLSMIVEEPYEPSGVSSQAGSPASVAPVQMLTMSLPLASRNGSGQVAWPQFPFCDSVWRDSWKTTIIREICGWLNLTKFWVSHIFDGLRKGMTQATALALPQLF